MVTREAADRAARRAEPPASKQRQGASVSDEEHVRVLATAHGGTRSVAATGGRRRGQGSLDSQNPKWHSSYFLPPFLYLAYFNDGQTLIYREDGLPGTGWAGKGGWSNIIERKTETR